MADILLGNVKGPQGDTGATGSQGPQGDAATITVGTVSTTAYGNTASVTNSGTAQDAVLDFVIPQGKPGEQTTRMGALTLDTITAQSADFPIPAVGETGSTVFGKIIKFFNSTISALNSKLNISDVVNNLTSTSTTQPLSAAQGKALNDASVNMKGTLASTTTEAQLLTLAPGVYQVWYAFTWLPKGAANYGTLISYMSGTSSASYGVLEYTDTNGSVWFRHHTRAEWHDTSWKCKAPRYVDFNVTLSGGSPAAQLNSNSGNVINQYNFLNAYVVDTNDVYLSIYTYANLVYARLLKYDGSAYTSGTYKVRAWYRD